MSRKPTRAKSKARRPVGRKPGKPEDSRVRDLEKRLAESLKREAEASEQRAASAEILRMISSSPTGLQSALGAVSENAARFCEASDAVILLVEGTHLRPAAHYGQVFAAAMDRPATRDSVAGRAVVDRETIHVPDVQSADDFPLSQRLAIAAGSRTDLATPLMREGVAVGAILIRRREVRPFTEKQIALLKTFADQAVFAIESVRLFTELEARNRDFTEALDRQTATAELLRVVSQSRTDLQPVFDAIAASARRLCRAAFAGVFTYDGAMVDLAALDNFNPQGADEIRRAFPAPAGNTGASTRAILAGVPVLIPDVEQDPEYQLVRVAATTGFRSLLSVPMVREGRPIGTITVARAEPGTFDDGQVELLKTFADQAVIAIENARLLSELETRNLDLMESLERQTATAEILRVISEAHGDAQPVFEAIAENALRLLRGFSVVVVRVDGDRLELVASRGGAPGGEAAVREALARMPRERGMYVWDAVLDRELQQIADVEVEPIHPLIRTSARARGWRANLAVPMLQEGEPIGVIAVSREAPGRFSPQQVELLKTFADQAAIAVKNAGLLTDLQARTAELTHSVEQLTALGEVGQAVSSSLDLETVLTTIVSRAVALTGVDEGVVFEYDEVAEDFTFRAASKTEGAVAQARRVAHIRKGEGVLGRTAVTGEPAQVADITRQGAYESRLREALLDSGVRALLAVPMLREGRLLGGIVLSRNRPGEFPPATVALLRTFATQSALAIQNARLYRELAEQGRQLEVASRHKSEFLASMSHELRTPLNAILGFNEMILGEIYGEVPSELREPLTEMQNSGRHLLRLINNVLDLSKIEAGRMELALADYMVPDVVEQVRASLQPLAADKGLEFVARVPAGLPLAHGDAGRITQCLTNLAGNALKFTREGRVELAAELQGETLVYRVSDTGIGIAPDRIETLFTEFRQADPTIASEFGGSGLGLSITRKFAEMHGGRVWVESEPGRGSTFFLALPLRVDDGATK